MRSEERLCDAAVQPCARSLVSVHWTRRGSINSLPSRSCNKLMYRDRIDEAKTRRLRQAAVARAAPTTPRVERLLALVVGSPLQARMR